MKDAYIQRDERRGGNAWQVKIKLPGIHKSFSDWKYGGKRKALLAAMAFRDEQLSKIKHSEHYGRRPTETGVLGVTYHIYRHTYKLKHSHVVKNYYPEFYRAAWTIWKRNRKPKVLTKNFSVKKYGRQNALALAIAMRTEFEKKYGPSRVPQNVSHK